MDDYFTITLRIPKPTRKWLQFSLWSLMLLTLAVSAFFAGRESTKLDSMWPFAAKQPVRKPVAVRLVAGWKNRPTAARKTTTPGVKLLICVAQRNIPAVRPLTARDVALESWPAERVPSGSVLDLAEAIGGKSRTLITRGEPITSRRLFVQ